MTIRYQSRLIECLGSEQVFWLSIPHRYTMMMSFQKNWLFTQTAANYFNSRGHIPGTAFQIHRGQGCQSRHQWPGWSTGSSHCEMLKLLKLPLHLSLLWTAAVLHPGQYLLRKGGHSSTHTEAWGCCKPLPGHTDLCRLPRGYDWTDSNWLPRNKRSQNCEGGDTTQPWGNLSAHLLD